MIEQGSPIERGSSGSPVAAELPLPWGAAAKPWGPDDIERWWRAQTPVRSYPEEVLDRIAKLPASALVERYGPHDQEFRRIRFGTWDTTRPKILITGGVHGYEIGGVDAALTFAERHASALSDEFDFAIFPCVNPLAFEYSIRWNSRAQDTNRHFCRDSTLTESGKSAPECLAFMDSVDELDVGFALAIDLHETTDRDLELRQAKIHRDGRTEPVNPVIPQGFYLVMNTGSEGAPIGQRIIESVGAVTKIADEPTILGVGNNNGVVYLDGARYPGLCMNYTSAMHRVTTEVYPDIISRQEALAGQLAAITGALDYVRELLR